MDVNVKLLQFDLGSSKSTKEAEQTLELYMKEGYVIIESLIRPGSAVFDSGVMRYQNDKMVDILPKVSEMSPS